MDFLIGILVIVIIILILINFASISVSDNSNINNYSKNGYNTNFMSPFLLNNNMNNYNVMKNSSYNIPSPVLANAPSALNNKIKLNDQTYDYSKYFYM